MNSITKLDMFLKKNKTQNCRMKLLANNMKYSAQNLAFRKAVKFECLSEYLANIFLETNYSLTDWELKTMNLQCNLKIGQLIYLP